MIYESVRQSATFFYKRQKEKQTVDEKLSFRWKFILIGLGIILLVLVGILSEFIKSLSQQYAIPINTTFLVSLLPNSNFFSGSISPLKKMIQGFSQTSHINFDNATKLTNQIDSTGQQIAKIIQEQDNLLLLLSVSPIDNPASIKSIGLYLHAYVPKIQFQSNKTLKVADPSDSMTSMMFSMNYSYSFVFSRSQSCFAYSYNPAQKQLSFLQMFHFGKNSSDSQISLEVRNYQCISSDKQTAYQMIRQYTQLPLDEKGKIKLKLNNLEIFRLTNDRVNFGYLNLKQKIIEKDGILTQN